MMNLLRHHRIHIPNGLAIFAAVLLLFTSAVGFEANQNRLSSDQKNRSSLEVEKNTDDNMTVTAEQKRRGLNLGLLLFRR